jgi:hypothetical protein
MTLDHDLRHLRRVAGPAMLAVVEDNQEAGDMWAEIRMILVVTHVTAGLAGLVVAPAVMAMHKGGRNHRRWGFVYFWAMMALCASALALMAYRPNPFLFGVTILSGYSALAGVRVLRRKLPGTPADRLDFAAAWVALGGGLLLLALAAAIALGWLPRFPGQLAIPAAVFGVLLGPGAWKDLRRLRQPPATRSWWWYEHMARMGGSYIALVTAFAVNQVAPRLPDGVAWFTWILPTLVGTPLLVLWVRRYRRRFVAPRSRGGRVPQPADVPAS